MNYITVITSFIHQIKTQVKSDLSQAHNLNLYNQATEDH